MREHRVSIERNILPAIGSVRLDRLTARHLDELYRSLLGRGLSQASVRRHHAILSAAPGRAVKWDWLTTNPAERASPPGLSRLTATAPSTEAVQRLVVAAQEEDPVLAAAVVLAAVTGARREGLCALRSSDMDCGPSRTIHCFCHCLSCHAGSGRRSSPSQTVRSSITSQVPMSPTMFRPGGQEA